MTLQKYFQYKLEISERKFINFETLKSVFSKNIFSYNDNSLNFRNCFFKRHFQIKYKVFKILESVSLIKSILDLGISLNL